MPDDVMGKGLLPVDCIMQSSYDQAFIMSGVTFVVSTSPHTKRERHSAIRTYSAGSTLLGNHIRTHVLRKFSIALLEKVHFPDCPLATGAYCAHHHTNGLHPPFVFPSENARASQLSSAIFDVGALDRLDA